MKEARKAKKVTMPTVSPFGQVDPGNGCDVAGLTVLAVGVTGGAGVEEG